MKKLKIISEFIISQHKQGIDFQNLNSQQNLQNENEAYEVQFLYQKNAGRGIIGGYKIALASKVQQKLCSIDNPIAGGIFKNEIYKSPINIELKNYHSLGLEFEIAFEISKDIDPKISKKNNFNIIRYLSNAYTCLELIDDRNASYDKLDPYSLIADNAWSSGIILGEKIVDWKNLDLNQLNSKLFWNDKIISEAKLNNSNPINSLLWIIKHLGKYNKILRKGSIIITGSIFRTKKPNLGDKIKFEVENNSHVSTQIT